MPSNFLPLFRRELRNYLTSPSVYVVAAMYFFLSGILFLGDILQFAEASTNQEYRRQMGMDKVNFTLHVAGQLFWAMNFLLVFIVPMVTMRLLAEEKKSGTFELITSLPFSDADIVTAKFMAAWTLLLTIIAGSSYYVGILMWLGKPELPVIGVAFIGLMLGSAAFTAIGLFASSLTENQIVAGIISFVALLFLFFVGDIFPASGSSGLVSLTELLSLRAHVDHFTRGLIRMEDVVYLVLLTLVFLFMTLRVMELRRWRA